MLYEYSLCNLYGENLRSTISLDNLAFSSQEWKPSPTSKFLTELGKCFAQVCVCLNAFSGGKKPLWIHAVSHTHHFWESKMKDHLLVIKPQPTEAASFSFMAFSNSLYKTCKFFKAWRVKLCKRCLRFVSSVLRSFFCFIWTLES